ncbi:helix-turn-helix domain-containing protein [Aminipila terrae]|uniref:Helix-turn-helix domain-containing protein n=1 Tax=Aminipila terrae TaxID=2697030 RepID=A0A6P1MEN5_9FIRM|nr:helix-turn-helix transcriptional regulator [Aminipila terrae]QHI71044.1 helix-turn-helix domain-containing protein [Aminipila terrae]
MDVDRTPTYLYNDYIGDTTTDDGGDNMISKNPNELHGKIFELRKLNGYTQQYVADYLDIDKSTYAHYEAGRRTPDVKKLKKLAELYNLEDELLGSTFPIEASAIYPIEMLDNLQEVINECKPHSGDYYADNIEFKKLREALKPIMQIRDEALDLPDIKICDLPSNTTVKRVYLDMRAESLIKRCLDKQSEVMNWK